MTGIVRRLALTVALLLWSPGVQAAQAWFLCELHLTGMNTLGSTFVNLTDRAATPAFTNKWFMLSDSVSKEMLAIALTAVAADLLVSVRTDLDEPGLPVIDNIFVNE